VAVEELNIRGLTGVDVALRVAGPGTRAYAFLIDWHIRLLLALALVLLGLLVTGRGSTAFQFGFALPAAILYLLYHPVLEIVMRGRTPGKRIAGARIVTLDGATPGMGALLMRNVFRLVDQLPALYLLGLAFTIWSPQRVRLGDLAAGTVLVLDEPKAAHSLGIVGALAGSSRLDPDSAALVRELLDRWREMDAREAANLARNLLRRLDAQLDPAQLHTFDRRALRARLESLLASA
jgi:uncharacterized RDD family membrane protein YckC